MTGRHTLYGQSLVRSANSLINLATAGATSKHWVKTWFNPPKKQDTNAAAFAMPSGVSSDNTTSNSTPQPPPAPVYEFKVHSWVLTEEVDEVKPEESDDTIDLRQFLYDQRREDANAAQNGAKTGGLSNADIRGAVGGADMIEFSSTAAVKMEDKVLGLELELAQGLGLGLELDEKSPESAPASVPSDSAGAESASVDQSAEESVEPAAQSESAEPESIGDGDIEMS